VSGAPVDNVFEVLVPDDADAAAIVMMGEELDARTGLVKEANSRELKRFDIPKDDRGAEGAGNERK
jgi:hypothetical protein